MVGAVFGDFPKNKCNFLHKNKLDILWRIQFSVQHPTKCFSWGSRYHCPMEVGAYACPKLWTLKILPRQVGLVIKKTRWWSSLLTVPATVDVRVVAVYCTFVNHNALTPLFRFLMDLLYNFFLQSFHQLITFRFSTLFIVVVLMFVQVCMEFVSAVFCWLVK